MQITDRVVVIGAEQLGLGGVQMALSLPLVPGSVCAEQHSGAHRTLDM
jgi:hypothetical protein